jgi:formylmethanofuran dehydrogenase subunit E
MPIEKLGAEVRDSDIDPSSITMNRKMQRQLCCSRCGETQFGLRRVRDKNGKKIRPAKYICMECYKDGRLR